MSILVFLLLSLSFIFFQLQEKYQKKLKMNDIEADFIIINILFYVYYY